MFTSTVESTRCGGMVVREKMISFKSLVFGSVNLFEICSCPLHTGPSGGAFLKRSLNGVMFAVVFTGVAALVFTPCVPEIVAAIFCDSRSVVKVYGISLRLINLGYLLIGRNDMLTSSFELNG